MRTFFKLLITIGILGVVDAVAFGGRYRTEILQEANNRGHTVQYDIQDWLKSIGL